MVSKTCGLKKKRADSKNSSASIEKQNDEILRRFVEKCVDSKQIQKLQ